MEKRLILFRHGKSDWETNAATDHARPLAKRGIKAARTMGTVLATAGQLPQQVVTSSAVRARTTVELAAIAGQWQCPVRVTDDLYEASCEQVLDVIHQIPEAIGTLLLAGHEPTWSQLTARLVGGGLVRVPTAAMVRIDFEAGGWSQVTWGSGQLIWLLQPKFFTKGQFDFLT